MLFVHEMMRRQVILSLMLMSSAGWLLASEPSDSEQVILAERCVRWLIDPELAPRWMGGSDRFSSEWFPRLRRYLAERHPSSIPVVVQTPDAKWFQFDRTQSHLVAVATGTNAYSSQTLYLTPVVGHGGTGTVRIAFSSHRLFVMLRPDNTGTSNFEIISHRLVD